MADSRTLKVNDLLKDIRIDYDSLSKLVEDVVSSIRETIDAIPEDFKVGLLFFPFFQARVRHGHISMFSGNFKKMSFCNN